MKNRNHKIIILSNFMGNKGVFIYILLLLSDIPINPYIIILGLILLFLGFNFISWYNDYYKIDEHEIRYTTGIFNKNTTVISISKVSTVDISQNVIYQLFNIAKLKLDSGAVNYAQTEISIVVSMQKANEIISILGKTKTEGKKNDYIKSSTKEVIIYAITRNTTIILGTIATINVLLNQLLEAFKIKNDFYNKIGTSIENSVGTKIFQTDNIKNLILSILIAIVIVYIVTKLLSVLYYILKFSNFTIYKEDNSINIKYGELSKKKYSLPIDKINSVTLKQNLIRQLLGLYSLEVSTVGYGNEYREEAILYPLCSINKAREVIEKLLPDYNMDLELQSVNKEGRRIFFMLPMIITSVLVITLSIIFDYGYISIVCIPLVFFICHLEYKNTSIWYCGEKFIATLGIFKKKIIIIKMDKVEYITVESTYFQRRNNLLTYKINYYGKSILESLTLKHLPKEHFANIKMELIKS